MHQCKIQETEFRKYRALAVCKLDFVNGLLQLSVHIAPSTYSKARRIFRSNQLKIYNIHETIQFM